jgi:hypothetical protein
VNSKQWIAIIVQPTGMRTHELLMLFLPIILLSTVDNPLSTIHYPLAPAIGHRLSAIQSLSAT